MKRDAVVTKVRKLAEKADVSRFFQGSTMRRCFDGCFRE